MMMHLIRTNSYTKSLILPLLRF